jgi:hypothetical protein
MQPVNDRHNATWEKLPGKAAVSEARRTNAAD